MARSRWGEGGGDGGVRPHHKGLGPVLLRLADGGAGENAGCHGQGGLVRGELKAEELRGALAAAELLAGDQAEGAPVLGAQGLRGGRGGEMGGRAHGGKGRRGGADHGTPRGKMPRD